MKKLLMTVMALSCFAFSSYGQKVEKQIIGKWCNPYTYESTGELKGFEFKKLPSDSSASKAITLLSFTTLQFDPIALLSAPIRAFEPSISASIAVVVLFPCAPHTE